MKLEMFVEEFVTYFECYKKKFEIFANPRPGEFLDLRKKSEDVRYIIDFNKGKVYVFSAEVIHEHAAIEIDTKFKTEKIEDAYYEKQWKNYDFGEGKIIGNKILIYQQTYGDYLKDKRFEKIKGFFKEGKKWKMLGEEWVASREKYGTTYEIFANPTKGELLDLKKSGSGKAVRYIVDFANGKVYVFRVNMLHSFAATVIDREKGTNIKKAYNQRRYENHDFSDGEIEGSKIKIYPTTYEDYRKDKRFEKIKEFFKPEF